MDTKHIEQLLSEFAADVINSAREKLRSDDHVATGRLDSSISGSRRELTVSFKMSDYWIYVNDGRRPGKQPPLAAIQDWCRSRGIDERLAFPIARKIGREGIKGDGFFTDALEKGLNELQGKLGNAVEADVSSALRVMVKEIKG